MPDTIPLPSEHKSWPAVFYPGTGDPSDVEGRIFPNAKAVPEGWVHSLGHVRPDRPAPIAPAISQPDRKALQAALDELGEVYKPNASLASLQKQLDEALAVLQPKEGDE